MKREDKYCQRDKCKKKLKKERRKWCSDACRKAQDRIDDEHEMEPGFNIEDAMVNIHVEPPFVQVDSGAVGRALGNDAKGSVLIEYSSGAKSWEKKDTTQAATYEQVFDQWGAAHARRFLKLERAKVFSRHLNSYPNLTHRRPWL